MNEELKKEIANNQYQNIKTFSNLNNNLISIGNDVKEIKHTQGKYTLILFISFFLVGVMLGTQYKIWLPYASDGYTIVKTVLTNKVK